MPDQPCEYCAWNGGTFDLNRRCRAARFVASLPSVESMRETAKRIAKHSQSTPEAIMEAAQAIRAGKLRA